MSGIIVAASILAYLFVGLFTARWVFGLMRAKSIDGWSYGLGSALEMWKDCDRGPAAAVSFVVLLAWPAAVVLVGAAMWFTRFLDGTARLSETEHRVRLAERDRRIAELEREAGIR